MLSTDGRFVLTSKVRPVAQLGLLVAPCQHADSAVLNEVHFPSHRALTDDEVGRLKHLEAQFGQHGRHKVGVSVGKQWHVSHQATAVKANDFLKGEGRGERETEHV